MIKQREDGLSTIHCDMAGCPTWSGPSAKDFYTADANVWYRVRNGERDLDLCGTTCLRDYATDEQPQWTMFSGQDADYYLWAERNDKRTYRATFSTADERNGVSEQWRTELAACKRDVDVDAWFREHRVPVRP